MSVTTRPAVGADAAALAAFAARTFRETYTGLHDPGELAGYLARAFGPERQAAELADPASPYLLAEADGVLAGFAWLRFGRSPACAALPDPVEIARFYVAREWHGRGVAQALMAAALAEARRRGARTTWLGVWQRNPRAIAFYRTSGFAVIGTMTWEHYSDPQDDWVMALDLDPARDPGAAAEWGAPHSAGASP